MAIQTIQAKTGLSRGILSEPFLTSLYRAQAPYRGCAHGCRYCDGRAEKYYVEGDFERDIAVRTNVSQVVAADVAAGFASREMGAVCIGSGVTDVYQPVERELGLTRSILEALLPAEEPLVILIKNNLILRDFDILSRFPKVLVIVTLTTVDPALAGIIEPGASLPSERLEVVAQAKAAGFFSGVMAMPLCPGLSDGGEGTTELFDAARKAGADFLQPGGLTLRPGRQKDLFMSLVTERFPELKPLYERVYRENRQSGMPLAEYAAPLMHKWNGDLEKLALPQMIPHRVHRELLSEADSLFVLFCHMQSLYSIKGVDTRPLRKATDLYAHWLSENRTALRRKRIPVVSSDPFPLTRILTEKLNEARASPETFELICGNRKLSELVVSLTGEGRFFDYSTLSVAENSIISPSDVLSL